VNVTDAIRTLNLPLTPTNDVRLCAVTCNVIYDGDDDKPQRIRATWYRREATVEIPQGNESYDIKQLITTAAMDAVKDYDRVSPNRFYEYDYQPVTVALMPYSDCYLAVIAALDRERAENLPEDFAALGEDGNVSGLVAVECHYLGDSRYVAIFLGVAYAYEAEFGMTRWEGMAAAATEAAKKYYSGAYWAKQFVPLVIALGEAKRPWVIVAILGDGKEE
jgi:hypothetical protein